MLNISNIPYINQIIFSGDIRSDASRFLIENNKSSVLEHSLAVSKANMDLARQFGLDISKAELAALLHDISSVMKPADMFITAENKNLTIDESEKKYPSLLHQRISAIFAKELFNINDPMVLSAIECHTTLKSNPSKFDMILFLADKLSWDQKGTPPFYNELSAALSISLEAACLKYIDFIFENNMLLFPHRWLLEAKKWLEAQASRV